MRAVIQRVSQAAVNIDGQEYASIGSGFLILLGIETADIEEDMKWLSSKIACLRIFSDKEGKMNLAFDPMLHESLLISQFTLHAQTAKGNRPSFIRAARPEQAIPLYEMFRDELGALTGKPVKTGVFGADMMVELVNDGPVTIIIDSKSRE